MTKQELDKLITDHKLWLENNGGSRLILIDSDLRRSDLSDSNLSGSDLSGSNLSGSNLSGSNLRRSDLSDSNLSGSNLSGSNLSGSNLRRSDLSDSNLSGSNLSGSNLSGSNLSGSNLSGSDLSDSNLSGSNLRRSDLSGSDLRRSNLSGVKNLFDPIQWFNDNFTKTEKGFIVYKGFGNTSFNSPDYWKIKEGEFIEEVCNPLPTIDCGCGVNFAPKKWIKNNYSNAEIWECLLHFEDLMTLVVPYNTDGKCRCSKLQLIKKL